MSGILEQKMTVGEFCQMLEDATTDAVKRGGDSIVSVAETLRWYRGHPDISYRFVAEEAANAIMDGIRFGNSA